MSETTSRTRQARPDGRPEVPVPTHPRFSDEAVPPPDDVGLAPSDRTVVVALGDSVMWGQGNRRSEVFSLAISQAVARPGTSPILVNRAHSGAQIRVRDPRQRDDFADIFPSLFSGDTDRDRFLAGDEGAADALDGEVPATFPTVTAQIASISAETAEKAEVVLLSGGANDVGFDNVVNPQVESAHWTQVYEPRIREVCHTDMLELLGKVRDAFPRAVICVFSYFPALSYDSDRGKIKAFFKHEADAGIGWWVNDTFDFVDVDRKIAMARVRAVWAHGLSSYWIRRAVLEAERDERVRGPGVLFVPSGFGEDNAMFAADPWVFDDYTHPTGDPVQEHRFGALHRSDQMRALGKALAQAVLNNLPSSESRALADAIDGPASLRQALRDGKVHRERTPAQLLAAELGRLQRGAIGSFFHPNRKGAASYAATATSRYSGYVATRDAIPRLPQVPDHVPQDGEGFAELLERYGVRGPGPLRGDVGHQFVDTLRVTTTTAAGSDARLAPDVQIVLRVRRRNRTVSLRYQLNYQYYLKLAPVPRLEKFLPHFEPGRSHSFYVDTGGSIRLSALRACRLELSAMPQPRPNDAGSRWRPERIRLEINGVEVVDLRPPPGTELGPGEWLDLGYPERGAPAADQPELASRAVVLRPDGQ